MEENKKTHWRRNDFRLKSLFMIVDGLQKSIKELEKNLTEIHWYDADWLMQETEPIYGLAFIAFQNYIIGSIADIDGTSQNKHAFFKKDRAIDGYAFTTIELITTLANYAKHKDEKLLQGTTTILDGFKLNYKDVIYLDEAAIFQGLDILDKDWDLFKIQDYVTVWRESLWISMECQN
ncbi:hypothetical protein [Mucilaginibacter flavidus]|uniref:hypothetical protein n=1 Tax=Mucilaginibacter flavidus TaxID=2949309 RepID=UPI002093D368|nr:hypothetical protein [Mucilaginibacter flavidus]MCO5946620.1 hypothetical protein [Mucilaginibacter flavidus]